MAAAYTRPKSLPDFFSPPLTEVVLGVQFAPPAGYQQIYAGEVWDLFRTEYPKIQEHPSLLPIFETFGLSPQFMAGQFNFLGGVTHDRFWFLQPDDKELIQFQQDRLLHNWRKLGDSENKYPKFKYMMDKFNKELNQFNAFINKLSPQQLSINQCEVSFINQIEVDEDNNLRVADWLKFLEFNRADPNDFTLTFREIIEIEPNKPQGRLVADVSSGLDRNGKRIINLSLTARGAPAGSDIKSAIDFLAKGHDLIVTKFAELTTDSAHKKWGRIK